MPLFRINHEIHFFAHVPKCGGSSVDRYLRRRFGPPAFLNHRYLRTPEAQRWTQSSPQHIDAKSLSLLFPEGWIASSIAVIRHPVARLRSAFDYQLSKEKLVPAGTDINDWLQSWFTTRDVQPFQFDNHLRPAVEFLPQNTVVFRLEDGLDALVPHLDRLAGTSDGPRKIPHRNQSVSGTDYVARQSPLSKTTMAAIAEIYAEDFSRFGYICEDVQNNGPGVLPPGQSRKSWLSPFRR